MKRRLLLLTPPMRVCLLVLALLSLATTASADDMKDSKYYTMSEHGDHMSFSVLLTDLNYKNTWAKDGYITAVRGSQTIRLVRVFTKEMSSDYNENYNVFANNELSGGIAFLTNANGGSKELSSSNQQFWVWKGSNNDRTYAKIDYYYPPQLAGNTWTFYYYYQHNNGNWYNMKLGSAYCSPTMGLKGITATDLEYERTDADKIEVTLPALPDDVPYNLQNNRKHVGKFNFTFTYTLYNGNTKIQKETYDCASGTEKTYTVHIPEEAINFQRVDMSVDVQDALYCIANDSYFWNNNSNISKTNIFPSVPQPEAFNADFLQFDGKVDLAWQGYHNYGNGYQYIGETKPYIYRLETDENGQKLSGKKWEQITILGEIGNKKDQTYADNSVEPNKYYKYLILNVPKAWAGNGVITSNELDSPSESTIEMLGHVESNVVATLPTMDIYDLAQDMSVEDQVVLKWKYSRVPVKSKNVSFQLLRRVTGTDSWAELGKVQAESNPPSGTVLSYTDETIASNRVRYEYKVQLEINDGENVFESDVITAGVIAGSKVTSLDATKGQHADLVRVTWKVKQVGTSNTHFELYRRYVNSGNEFMKIYATSGVSDTYTYEDNTAQPGYYYEYKIEAYAGDKDSYDDTSYQNALSAIGFCQSTGVISGRVTFGSAGTAVGDVRMTLRASETGEGGDMQQFSQRVEGATTGITWVAAPDESAKLFGQDKDYTVQMFVRPDENLAEGSVFGEIPGMGTLKLGAIENGSYPLLIADKEIEKEYYLTGQQYEKINYIRVIYYWNNNNSTTVVKGQTVYSKSERQGIELNWKSEGYIKFKAYAAGWIQEGCQILVYTKCVQEPFFIPDTRHYNYHITTITQKTEQGIPSNTYSLLSIIKNDQELAFAVNDSISTTLTTLGTKEEKEENAETEPIDNALPELYTLTNNHLCCFEGTLDAEGISAEWMYSGALQETPSQEVATEVTKIDGKIKPSYAFSVGGASGISDEEAFRGNLCEVRVWDHALTEKEHANTDDRILSGNETGLKLYWPMSEGIDRLVVDASYTNEVPNGHHATVGTNVKSSRIVPSDNILSRYAMTNSSGEYTLRGIPFVGSGSTYTITPTKNIHEFSPSSRNGFISGGSLTLNNYDFTDQSSFTVRGKVTYKNTNIPADSVMFKIDGDIAQKGNKHVMTDANGEYELSVPIGSHTIEAYKEGHVFSVFPNDGTVYAFYQDEIVNFFDSTLVNVTGRINGGFSDKDEPLGFRRSTNRLGKATLKLSLGKQAQCSFNYIVDKHGNGEFGTKPIPVESATSDIHSTAYRAGGSHDDTFYIYITTDSLTGEFSALLPPLRYHVNSITFDNGSDYDNEPVFKDNLPIIDATNAIADKMQCDSLVVDNENKAYYFYSAKLIRQYRTIPTITVTQDDMENGAFGVRSVTVKDDITSENIEVPVLEMTENGYHYLYGHPFFVQGNPYKFTIQINEQYKNLDTKEIFEEVPQDAVVNIYNEASSSASEIAAMDFQEGEQQLHPGDVYDVDNVQVIADEEGHVRYGFIPNYPSLSDGYLRNLTISVNVEGRNTLWHAPDSRTDALDFVVTGGITTGTNFVTGAPNQIDQILRRPPGSTAYAQWGNDSVYVKTTTTTETSSFSFGGGLSATIMPSISVTIGQGVYQKTKWRFIFNDDAVKRNNAYDDIEIAKESNTYSVSTTIKTPSSGKFVQNMGDTYIGRASNLMFGKGRFVGLIKQNDGTYKLGDKESLCTALTYSTTFVLPQQYVIETLIPNWKAIIKSKLKYVPELTETYCKTVEGEEFYYTTLQEGDYGYGSANSDENVWSLEQRVAAGGHPSYLWVDGRKHTADEVVTDSVEWCNQQISVWEQTIRNNEKDKLKAFGDNSFLIGNFSIGGGTVVSQTTKEQIINTKDLEHTKTSWNVTSDTRIGATFNDAGLIGSVNLAWSGATEKVINESITETRSTTWQISDASPATALSVDVYNSPSGWGPIFRTRGGQTCNPYEGATYTKYYQKGTELDKATMRIENPKLSVEGSSELTDIPTGTKAEFKLKLSNESETNNTCTYVLEALEGSNPNGAKLTIDGQTLSVGRDGRKVTLGGNESIIKTLYVEQTDRSVTEYDNIRLVLRSENDITTQSDPVILKVHFIPASAYVEISTDHTILNYDDYIKKGGIMITLTNLNRQDKGLEGVRIQYRRKGHNTWSLAKEWKANPGDGETAIPAGDSFSEPVIFAEDGIYEVRGQTFGTYGPSTEVTYATPIIEVTQDTRGPKILGSPYPEMGYLSYALRNGMYVRFNEDINTNALSKSDNFRIVGNLNNAITDKKVPDVALQLNSEEITTQATYQIGSENIAIEGWFYRQSDGTVFSIGTEDNMLAFGTHDNGKVYLRLGAEDNIVESNVTLPANIWNFLALSIEQEKEGKGMINAIYVNADTPPVYILKEHAFDYTSEGEGYDIIGNGKMHVGGNGMTGMLRDLALWNTKKTVTQLYENRGELKANYTPGLIGYWRMDEGHGTTVVDRINSSNMVLPAESWYINNKNLAAHLDDYLGMKVDITNYAPQETDNFAIELWFRTEDDEDSFSELIDLNNHKSISIHNNCIGLDETIHNEMGVYATTSTLSEINVADRQWHHFAMNVRRGSNVTFYIDGEPVKTLPASTIPAPKGPIIYFGKFFKGDIDDIRIWSAALSSDMIADRRYHRLDSTYVGLIGYFPMESIDRDESGTVTSKYAVENFGDKSVINISMVNADEFPQAANAPALLPGSQRLRLEEKEFSYIASDREIYFQFPDEMLPRMDGNEFNVTISYVKDLHDNIGEPIVWQFKADFAQLSWMNNDGIYDIYYERSGDMNFYETLVNSSATNQTYEILNLPTWMSVDKPIGTISGTSNRIIFTIHPSAPIGTHTVYIYVSDCNGIKRSICRRITVQGNEPNWAFNSSLYESSMAIVGQLIVAEKISDNPRSVIGAFDALGVCRGLANPEYMSTRDAYYLNMYVYGNSDSEYNDLTFKMYDASTGNSYPLVHITLPNGTETDTLTFAADALYGNYDTPVLFKSAAEVQQTIDLALGWSWMSIYVQPSSTAIADVLPKDKNTLKELKNIKGQFGFSSVSSDGKIVGEVTEIVPGNMYKIQAAKSLEFNVIGLPINVRTTSQTIHHGYNWIGTLSSEVMSPAEAFADLKPEHNDLVKNRSQVAMYRGNGVWEGTLQSIVPGMGYLYYSRADGDKSFHYPKLGTQTSAHTPRHAAPLNAPAQHYTPTDPYNFPDNMNVIAVVVRDGQLLNDVEIGAFVNGECRGAIRANEGSDYYFLTVMGSSAEDQNRTVELRVFANGEEYVVDRSHTFINDLVLGNLDEPYVLDLDEASGIKGLYTGEGLDDDGWYSLHGFKLPRKPVQPGVYIHKGTKVVIE